MKRLLLLLFVLQALLVPPTFAADVPQAYLDAVKLQEDRTFNENAVLSFVYNTYYMFDKHVAVDDFLRNLSDKDLLMKFPEAELKNHADFQKWYKGVGDSIQSNTHTVQSVKVKMDDDGTFGVHVIVLWQAQSKKGDYMKFKADQNWTLIDDNGRLKIREYLVKEAK